MLVRLYTVIDREDDSICDEVKAAINAIVPKFSFSPSREQPQLANCFDFFGTADNVTQEEVELLLATLNNDWDGEMDDCSAYGFNTKMFHPRVYYLQFQIQ